MPVGATQMDNDTNNFWAGKEWLADDETGVAQNGHPLYDSNATQGGMYGPWQIWATWYLCAMFMPFPAPGSQRLLTS